MRTICAVACALLLVVACDVPGGTSTRLAPAPAASSWACVDWPFGFQPAWASDKGHHEWPCEPGDWATCKYVPLSEGADVAGLYCQACGHPVEGCDRAWFYVAAPFAVPQ